MFFRIFIYSFILFVVGIWGCSTNNTSEPNDSNCMSGDCSSPTDPESTGNTDSSDADTDSDTDSDADSDTDTDSQTGTDTNSEPSSDTGSDTGTECKNCFEGDGGAGSDTDCDFKCPGEYWDEIDGSPSCSCAASLAFGINESMNDDSYIILLWDSITSADKTDSYEFVFHWIFDDPNWADEELEFICTILYHVNDENPYPPESNTTFFFHDDYSSRNLDIECRIYSAWVYELPIIVDEGFFSVRSVKNTFEGHILFIGKLEDSTYDTRVLASGSFSDS